MPLDCLELSKLRRAWLSLEGDDAVEIHGWLVGVGCALERGNGCPPEMVDRLVQELRQSTSPLDASANPHTRKGTT